MLNSATCKHEDEKLRTSGHWIIIVWTVSVRDHMLIQSDSRLQLFLQHRPHRHQHKVCIEVLDSPQEDRIYSRIERYWHRRGVWLRLEISRAASYLPAGWPLGPMHAMVSVRGGLEKAETVPLPGLDRKQILVPERLWRSLWEREHVWMN